MKSWKETSLLSLNLTKPHSISYRLLYSCLLVENTVRPTDPPNLHHQAPKLYTTSLNDLQDHY